MTGFFKYFYEIMVDLFESVADLFKGIFTNLFSIFNLIGYALKLKNYAADLTFNFWDWLFSLFSLLLLTAALILFLYYLLLFGKKYFRLRKTFVEKEELVEQIDDLNHRVIRMMKEKEKILAMQVSKLGLRPGEGDEPLAGGETKDEQAAKHTTQRFVKLMTVDKEYSEKPFAVTDPQNFTLQDVVVNFRNFACKELRLFYEERIIRQFIAGLATSKIIILEGISGTGKTSLPYALGKYLKYDSPLISVQPSWRDRSELIGYLNEFTKRFNESDFLMKLYEATYRDDVELMILDELNLARIEYYFAEILSVLEMPNPDDWKIDIVPDTWATDPVKIEKGKLAFPTNVWFVGTANNDDSTFTITDKVYDRAVAIPINTKGVAFEPDAHAGQQSIREDYLISLFEKAKKEFPMSEELASKFAQLDDFMIVNFRLTFGNRIMKQIRTFLPVYVACGGTDIDGLDFMLTTKILRKLQALNISFEQDNIKKLIVMIEKIFGKNNMTDSKDYLKRLLRK